MGNGGAVLVLLMLFMAVTSTGSAEQIAVSSLFAYDVYRAYFNRKATGKDVRPLPPQSLPKRSGSIHRHCFYAIRLPDTGIERMSALSTRAGGRLGAPSCPEFRPAACRAVGCQGTARKGARACRS